MTLLQDLGQFLADQHHGTYSETDASTIFLEDMPAEPDALVVLNSSGGFPADAGLGYDTPNVQVVVRDPDPVNGWSRCADIYATLHGFAGRALVPGGAHVVSCFGVQSSPVRIGPDDNGRHRFSINFELEVRSLSAHRV